MKAIVFARLNAVQPIITGYHQLKIGPYIRREKSKRKYTNYFTFQKSIAGELFDKWRTSRMDSGAIVDEPPLEKINDGQRNKVYRFAALPHWDDYFKGLKNHRTLVLHLFEQMLNKKTKEQLAGNKAPVIGVHVRRGDFRGLRSDEEFSKVGTVRTPERYFVETIVAIRRIHGAALPVSVFTDGYPHEFAELFSMSNVTLIKGNLDIVDMILLSKSKIIITSAGSTFSYWAGFLSRAPVIMHPEHIHEPLRTEADLYEGPMNPDNAVLIRNIREISGTTKDS